MAEVIGRGRESPTELLVQPAARVKSKQACRQRGTSMSKSEFLMNIRTARRLFENQRGEETGDLSRVSAWLTPKSVEHFNAADFPELGERQADLQDAVLAFRTIATEVPANDADVDEQLGNARVAFERILKILDAYLPAHQEGRDVEAAVSAIQFPDWIVTWDFELGSDDAETPSVWLNLYADEESAPKGKLGVEAARLTQALRASLAEARINRWPYVRLRSAQKHKAR